MDRRRKPEKSGAGKWLGLLGVLVVLVLGGFFFGKQFLSPSNTTAPTNQKVTKTSSSSEEPAYQASAEEKAELAQRFKPLLDVNKETVAYVYAPGTELDEPVVQTTDNATYLDKTFEGGNQPFLGTVFMDTDNNRNFSDRLTWLFGHARGSKVGDHRMFNDVNFYSDPTYFEQHPYVVIETPERKFYYEAMAMVIVPETTAFYRTSFKNDKDFTDQLNKVREDAQVKNENIKISAKDKYLVLSTCREEDETIRANLYLRRIPDAETASFAKEHADQLKYVATRTQ